MKRILSTIIFLAIAATGFSQYQTLYFMDAVPHSRMNPAVPSTNSGFFGFPALGAFQFAFASPRFKLTDFTEQQDKKLVVDLNDLYSELKNTNRLNLTHRHNLFAFGFKASDMYFDVGLTLRNEFRAALPGDAATLVKKGNSAFVGDPADFSPLWFSGLSYMEFGIGVNRKIDEKLTVGVRPKILFGIANSKLSFDEFEIETNSNTGEMDFRMDGAFKTSLPLKIERDEEGQIEDLEVDEDLDESDFIMKNSGFSIDFGGHYQFTDQIEFEAAVVDLGYISWSSSPTVLESKGSFKFEGLRYNGSEDDDVEDITDRLVDDIEDTFKVKDSKSKYRTWLPTKILLGARYKVNKQLKVGGLIRNRIYNKSFQPALTLSAYYQPIKFIGLTGSYSMAEGGFANFGTGINLNLGAMQLHFVTDNLKGLLTPHDTHYVSLHFGLNWTFGFRKRPRPDKQEKQEEEEPKKNEGEIAPVY